MPEPAPFVVPTIEVELLGKTRHLRLDFAGIAAAERVTGKPFLALSAIANAGASGLTSVLWGCLLHEDPDLKLRDVQEAIHFGNAPYFTEKVMEAVAACYPDPDDLLANGDDGTEDPTEGPQPGQKSGRSRGSNSKSKSKSSGD